MKVARLYDIDDIRLEDVPRPTPRAGELLVQTVACGICTGELMPWYMRQKAPFVFGHEPVGRVSAVGKGMTEFHPGDRVFVHHHAPCLRCKHCRRGEVVQCATWRRTRLNPGGMAQYFTVPNENLIDVLRLPDSVSAADGTLIEPAACAVKALDLARIQPGDTVLVIGLGFMGLLLAKLARAFGAGRVLGADLLAARRHKGLAVGVDAVIDPGAAPLATQVRAACGGDGADVVVVGPPFTQPMQDGIAAAGPGARVVLFSPAPPGEKLAIEPHDLYFREVSLIPSYSCGPDHTRQALGFLTAGVVRAEDVVTHHFPFEQVAEAYAAMRQGDALKAVVHFDLDAGDHTLASKGA